MVTFVIHPAPTVGYLPLLPKAYFSFRNSISPINSRVPEPENTVNRIQASGPAESSQDDYHSPSYKSSPILRDSGRAFGLRPMSPLHKYDRPLKRGALKGGGNPCGQSNRYVNPSQSPQQLQSNLAFAKDASGFMREVFGCYVPSCYF
jgi:hypothetical protein